MQNALYLTLCLLEPGGPCVKPMGPIKFSSQRVISIWGQSPRNESSVALGSIVVIAMYSVYVLKIDPPTTFKIFPKIDLLMSCSLCPQSLGHENIS